MEEKTLFTEINGVIEKTLIEKTFNLEIIEKIKEIRDRIESLSKENESLNENNKEYIAKVSTLDKSITVLEEQNAKYREREKTLSEAEREQEKLRYTLDFQLQRANEIKEIFSLVFRNPVVKENVISTFPMERSGNGYTS